MCFHGQVHYSTINTRSSRYERDINHQASHSTFMCTMNYTYTTLPFGCTQTWTACDMYVLRMSGIKSSMSKRAVRRLSYSTSCEGIRIRLTQTSRPPLRVSLQLQLQSPNTTDADIHRVDEITTLQPSQTLSTHDT